ncbi:MAG: hypothetical protein K1X67_06380 [Fimbriimonadaceae bacterium]|nr:hypothetical protein [Fimbriimonadaceae bacterium]
MSISQVRNFMDKSGCAWIVGISLVIVFILGLWMQAPRENKPDQAMAEGPEVLSVGTSKVNSIQLQQALDLQASQMQAEGGDPLNEFQVYSLALKRIVDSRAKLDFAISKGVKLDEAKIMEIYLRRMAEGKTLMRKQLIEQKKIKENATDAEFLAAAKEAGMDFATQEAQIKTELPKALADPTRRDDVLDDVIGIALQDLYLKTTKISDADLEKNYVQNTYKQIMVSDEATPEANKKVAEKILAEIKAGKSFEAAMEQYVKTPPAAGKKKSDQTQDLPASLVEKNEFYKDLAGMKPGEVRLVDMRFGPVLYKFVSTKKDLPKDFATKKETYRENLAREEAFRLAMQDADKYKDQAKIAWKSPGYESVYQYGRRLEKGELNIKDFAKLKAEIEPLMAKAREAAESDPEGRRPAVLAQFAMMDQLWRGAKTPEQKKALEEERMRIISETLEVSESGSARLELAQMLLDKKDPAAVEQVIKAAEANVSTGPMGAKTDSDIVGMLTKLKAAKLGTPEELKKIDDEHQRWLKDRQAELQAQAEARMEEEKARREAEAEAKKEEEEAKKNQPTPKARDEKPAPPGNPLSGGQKPPAPPK